jgi:hypothetical protein
VPATTGNEFLDRLLEQTPEQAEQPKRGQNYNFPLKLYLKPDGEVVRLQGDPINESYYRKKGYHLLNDQATRGQAKSEVEQYLQDEYPKILAEQQEKAAIINAIRRAVQSDRNLTFPEDGWEELTVAEMRDILEQFKEETGKNVRIIRPRAQKPTRDPVLAGVETTEGTSIEQFAARRERGAKGPS